MAETEIKRLYDGNALVYSLGALTGGIVSKLIPTNLWGNFGAYADLILGVIFGAVAYFLKGEDGLPKFFVGGSIFLIADGILRVIMPSFAL